MVLSWLRVMECIRLHALVGEAEWTASLNDRVADLPELPPDHDPFFSILGWKNRWFYSSTIAEHHIRFHDIEQSDAVFADAVFDVLSDCMRLSTMQLRRKDASPIQLQGRRKLDCNEHWVLIGSRVWRIYLLWAQPNRGTSFTHRWISACFITVDCIVAAWIWSTRV